MEAQHQEDHRRRIDAAMQTIQQAQQEAAQLRQTIATAEGEIQLLEGQQGDLQRRQERLAPNQRQIHQELQGGVDEAGKGITARQAMIEEAKTRLLAAGDRQRAGTAALDRAQQELIQRRPR